MWGSNFRSAAKPPGSRIREALKPLVAHNAVVDRWVETIPEDLRASSPCLREGAGCAHCCRQMVMTSIPEALLVVSDLVQLPDGIGWLRDVGLAEIQRQRNMSAEPGMSNVGWFKRGIRCAFLDKDDRCVVYRLRPVVCRTYLVVDGGPDQCTVPERRVKCLDTRDVDELTARAVERVASELRVDPRPLPLPVAVDWALTGYFQGLGELRRRLKGASRVEACVGEDGTIVVRD